MDHLAEVHQGNAVDDRQAKEAILWSYLQQLKSAALDSGVHDSIFTYPVDAVDDADDDGLTAGERASERDGVIFIDDSEADASDDEDEDDKDTTSQPDQGQDHGDQADNQMGGSGQGVGSNQEHERGGGNPTTTFGVGGRTSAPPTAASSSTVVPLPSAWDQAIKDANLPEGGDGLTRDTPIITGDNTEVSGTPCLTFPLTANCDATTARARQDALATSLQEMRWLTHTNLGQRWLMLHPWAVRLWVKHLTSRIFSIEGIRRVNKILSDARKAIALGDPQGDLSIARGWEDNMSITADERKLFQNIVRVVQHQVPQNSKYDDFMFFCDQVTLYRTIEELILKCQIFNPQNPQENKVRMRIWAEMGSDGSVPSTSPRAVTAMVKSYVKKCMGWKTPAQYNKVIGSIAPMVPFVTEYGLAFCLFVDQDFVRM